MSSRRRTPEDTETEVLIASRRRCALCFGLFDDLDQKRGQIAHVDRDASNANFDNLAFLCLPHHDEYDSRTSQSKRFTPAELTRYRERLYERFREAAPVRTEAPVAIAEPPTERHEPPRSLTAAQRRTIAQRLKAWSGHRDLPQNRRITIAASPIAFDARQYAAQLRMAFEAGEIWSEDVWDFTWGSEIDDREQFRETNAQMLNAHHANVTVWGSDATQHEDEPLDQVLIGALTQAGVDVIHQPGATSIGGMVAIIVGAAGRVPRD
jgi:hypothetical protein